jgi:hypothetical protein
MNLAAASGGKAVMGGHIPGAKTGTTEGVPDGGSTLV